MYLEHLVRREALFPTLWTAQWLTNLVFGAQVVHIAFFTLEHLVAELAHKLKAEHFRLKRRQGRQNIHWLALLCVHVYTAGTLPYKKIDAL